MSLSRRCRRDRTGIGGRLDRHVYGCMLQNLIAGPLAGKLATQARRSVRQRNHPARNPSIQAGNNPRVVEMQLLSFLSNKQQESMPKAA